MAMDLSQLAGGRIGPAAAGALRDGHVATTLRAGPQPASGRPYVHDYESAVFANTVVCISLRMELAKYCDKIIHVPERRYEKMCARCPVRKLDRSRHEGADGQPWTLSCASQNKYLRIFRG